MISYLDPTHVTDELYQGEEGDVDVRRVVGVGCLCGELHVYVGECFHVPEIRIYVVMYIYILYILNILILKMLTHWWTGPGSRNCLPKRAAPK